MKRIALLLLVACGPVEIIVAMEPPPCDERCVGPDFFCEALNCGSSKHCVRLPPSCDGLPRDASCGCDNKMYQNVCERQLAGVSPGTNCPQ